MINPPKRHSNHEAYSPSSKVKKSPEGKKIIINAKVADTQANVGRSQIKALVDLVSDYDYSQDCRV